MRNFNGKRENMREIALKHIRVLSFMAFMVRENFNGLFDFLFKHDEEGSNCCFIKASF